MPADHPPGSPRRTRLLAGLLAALSTGGVAAAGCTDGGTLDVNRLTPKATPDPGGSPAATGGGTLQNGLAGGITTGASPGSGPSASPTPLATPAASPTPTPGPVAYSILISPAAATISLPAAPGSDLPPAGYPTGATLSAIVLLSDNTSTSSVTWSSSEPDVASVDAAGRVTAQGPGSGPPPWKVLIQATSPDGKAVAAREIVVTDGGDVAVVVE